MKMKTSVTLSGDILEEIDRLAGPSGSRSAVIEAVLRRFVRSRKRAQRSAHDIAALNRVSDRLNAEAADVLSYQSWPSD